MLPMHTLLDWIWLLVNVKFKQRAVFTFSVYYLLINFILQFLICEFYILGQKFITTDGPNFSSEGSKSAKKLAKETSEWKLQYKGKVYGDVML